MSSVSEGQPRAVCWLCRKGHEGWLSAGEYVLFRNVLCWRAPFQAPGRQQRAVRSSRSGRGEGLAAPTVLSGTSTEWKH